MELFDRLWDEHELKLEITEQFSKFNEAKWSLNAGISSDMVGMTPEDFARSTQGFVYQAAWNCATNQEKDKYTAIVNIAKEYNIRTALDYGCGIGSGVISLALTSIGVLGAEVNLPCIEVLASRIERFGLSDWAKVWDLYKLPQTVETSKIAGDLDMVICTEVFEHLEDPHSTAERLVSMIKPGGVAIFSWSFVPMVGHLPQHFHLQAPHPDQLLTMGFGKFVQELGMELKGYSWFNNMIWEKK